MPTENYGFISRRLAAEQMLKNIRATTALRNALLEIKPRPLTRREKIERWVGEWRYRFSTAWRVLRGDDIHHDCY
jgi:hypothetical protein